jgi:uncharacterized protein YggE
MHQNIVGLRHVYQSTRFLFVLKSATIEQATTLEPTRSRLMRLAITVFLILASQTAFAQVSGNVGYGQIGGRSRAEQNERAKRTITKDEMPQSNTSVYLDANILMNVKANEFVATFGVVAEAETVAECQTKIDKTIAAFSESVKRLGIADNAIFVDFTGQTKVYNFKLEANVAKEQLGGFELKKTVAIRYRDKNLIDRLLSAASKEKIYDLIRVDYVVTELAPIQERMAEIASEVIKTKVLRQQRLLGVKLKAVPQVIADRQSVYHPTEMYDSYAAAETEAVSSAFDRNQVSVQTLRKSRTFYYNPLTADGFDRVIEPIILEPVVQFTLYLKVKYELEDKR